MQPQILTADKAVRALDDEIASNRIHYVGHKLKQSIFYGSYWVVKKHAVVVSSNIMRKVILQLAVSLDGFIEGPKGEFDWCFTDQDYGMSDFFKRIDSIFIGRRSYELTQAMGDEAMPGFPKLTEYVFSNSLKNVKPGAILVSGDIEAEVKRIKNEPGKDIWLFGGASLTSALLRLNLLDELILAVHPILLGNGKPLFKDIEGRINLKLIGTQTYSTGLVMLTYHLQPPL